jgi:hypothetical protein
LYQKQRIRIKNEYEYEKVCFDFTADGMFAIPCNGAKQ